MKCDKYFNQATLYMMESQERYLHPWLKQLAKNNYSLFVAALFPSPCEEFRVSPDYDLFKSFAGTKVILCNSMADFFSKYFRLESENLKLTPVSFVTQAAVYILV